MFRTVIAVAALCVATPLLAAAPEVCRAAMPASQLKDIDTIKQLETGWITAEYRGNVNFLDCLLDANYHVIVTKKNEVRSKADLLAQVAKSKGGTKPVPALATTVVINGDVATAYSLMTGTKESGETYSASYVDVYSFSNGRWTALSGVDL
jgi:ketosteroid isomerase-like protein